MKVWVAVTGCYENTGVDSVWTDPHDAMEHLDPKGKWDYDDEFDEWQNDRDWDDAIVLMAYELKEPRQAIQKEIT